MASSRKAVRSKPPAGEAIDAALAATIEAALGASIERNGVRGARLCVALSGGIDSVAMLHAVRELAPRYALRVSALHVNHGISLNSRAWEEFCRTLCKHLRIPLTVRRVKVARRGRGLEAAAREARYKALAGAQASFVALAHQRDDQAETVLFNLLRGTGLAGASGMAECGPLHGAQGAEPRALRPLLGVTRDAIEVYARRHSLAWIEDESNADEMLTRNWLRRRVGPLLAARFPRWREALARAAAHFAEAQALLAGEPARGLTVEALRAAAPARAKILLRGFLRAHGLRPPGAPQTAEMLHQLVCAPPDARIELRHDAHVLRRYRGELLLSAAGPTTPFAAVAWNGEAALPLPQLGGELRFRAQRGAGLDVEKLRAQPVTVRIRRGGERLRLAAGRPSRSLKNLYQEAGIPPWERDGAPLLYCGEELVWVPGLGVASAYAAAKGHASLLPEWNRNPAD